MESVDTAAGARSASGSSRPGSGLWSLLGWLRRDSSSESISSSGSARTAASFAFLPGTACRHAAVGAGPRRVSPPPPPTDSYRRRVRERDVRRCQEQDLTLTRKYHLPHALDACTLPAPPRRRPPPEQRVRRAASEAGRRAAHVPGKRPAPQPPRQRPKKRPAPPPPHPPYTIPLRERQKSQIQMEIEKIDFEMKAAKEVNSEIASSSKQEMLSNKEKKINLRPEQNFLKHIFEIKKSPATVRLLPNISELDRQATQLLQEHRLRTSHYDIVNNSGLLENIAGSVNNFGTWICTQCLRKYENTVVTCLHCIFESNKDTPNSIKRSVSNNKALTNSATISTTSSNLSMSEKEKLKDMLKEIKKSLPNRTKSNTNDQKERDVTKNKHYNFQKERDHLIEAPTLPIGEALTNIKNEYQKFAEVKTNAASRNSSKETSNSVPITPSEKARETVFITQTVVLEDPGPKTVSSKNCSEEEVKLNKTKTIKQKNICIQYEPMKMSSLLNPVYVSKSETEERLNQTSVIILENSAKTQNKADTRNGSLDVPIKTNSNANKKPIQKKEPLVVDKNIVRKSVEESKVVGVSHIPVEARMSITAQPKQTFLPSTSCNIGKPRETLDQFTKRRDLINQLERSIASGDERAASEAAVKLAQLRLSCSVLSFSSQIMSGNNLLSYSACGHKQIDEKVKSDTKESSTTKVSTASQVTNLSLVTIGEWVTETTPDKIDETCKIKDDKANTLSKAKEKNVFQTSQQSTSKAVISEDHMVNIEVWVEDAAASRGPALVAVPRAGRLRELRAAAERSLRAPARLQRWVVRRALAADDDATLRDLAGPHFSAPFYLCIVDSGGNNITDETKQNLIQSQSFVNEKRANDVREVNTVFNELLQFELNDILPNSDAFECEVCLEECGAGAGGVVRECLHAFCRECLGAAVRHCEQAQVGCPAAECGAALQEREVRALVSPAEYERWLARGLAQAESGARHAFHCRTRDCAGWALAEPPAQRFPCPVCRAVNCVPCKAIHDNETCEQYKKRLKDAAKVQGTGDIIDDNTKNLIDSLISRGEALECPECNAIITKKWGCDWVRCSACKTEICWVTRGRRWGPRGRGDVSAGCRCGVDGKRCHPSCAYCH